MTVAKVRRARGRAVVGLAVGLLVAVVVGGCLPSESSRSASAPTPRVPTAGAPAGRLTPVPGLPGDPDAGRRAFVTTGCGGCHTLPSGAHSGGGAGVAGPILTNVVVRPTLAGQTIPMSPETMTRWLLDPAAVKPGTPMPNVGLDEQQARDLTAYLYSLPNTPP